MPGQIDHVCITKGVEIQCQKANIPVSNLMVLLLVKWYQTPPIILYTRAKSIQAPSPPSFIYYGSCEHETFRLGENQLHHNEVIIMEGSA